MPKESTYATITPVLTDYLRGIGTPGGTPDTANIVISALLTLMRSNFRNSENFARVTSDFSKTSDTTLANITGLTVDLIAGGVYRFRAHLFISNGASGGTKIAVSGTCTATAIVYRTMLLAAAGIANLTSTALDEAEGATAAHVSAIIDGVITVANAGTLTIQLAQNASNGTATSALVGSWLEVEKIG